MTTHDAMHSQKSISSIAEPLVLLSQRQDEKYRPFEERTSAKRQADDPFGPPWQ